MCNLICGSGSRCGVLVDYPSSYAQMWFMSFCPDSRPFGFSERESVSSCCNSLRALRLRYRLSGCYRVYIPLKFPPAVLPSSGGDSPSFSVNGLQVFADNSPSPTADFGSVLSLASIPSGNCPVAVSLSRFSWPVRSAVLVSLLLALRSRRSRGLALPPALVALRSSFLSAAVASLGFSVSCWLDNCRSLASSFVIPPCVPSFSFFSLSAVVSAVSSLSRCLSWLVSRGGCPPALRPVLASVVMAFIGD